MSEPKTALAFARELAIRLEAIARGLNGVERILLTNGAEQIARVLAKHRVTVLREVSRYLKDEAGKRWTEAEENESDIDAAEEHEAVAMVLEHAADGLRSLKGSGT